MYRPKQYRPRFRTVRRWRRRCGLLAAGLALVSLAACGSSHATGAAADAAAGAPSTHAAAASPPAVQAGVTVTMGSTMTVAGATRWHPGSIRITGVAKSGEQELTLLRFHAGYGYKAFVSDGTEANRPDPGATSAMQRVFSGTDFLGGVNVFPGHPAAFTATVAPGTYYLGEMNQNPTFHRIEVGGQGVRVTTPAAATVTAADFGYRLNRPTLPAPGAITVRNTGRQIHRLTFMPVKPGTTVAQVGAYLRSTGGRPYGTPPPFALDGPQLGLAMLSPGQQVQFSYDLPPGAYALVCFQPDVATGQPHAVLGMFTVATLR
jgi:hypothetical protein